MIETFCKALIEELGATGILLLGLTIIAIHVSREISRPLKVINHEIGEIRDLLKEALVKLDNR